MRASGTLPGGQPVGLKVRKTNVFIKSQVQGKKKSQLKASYAVRQKKFSLNQHFYSVQTFN